MARFDSGCVYFSLFRAPEIDGSKTGTFVPAPNVDDTNPEAPDPAPPAPPERPPAPAPPDAPAPLPPTPPPGVFCTTPVLPPRNNPPAWVRRTSAAAIGRL